MLVLFFSQNVLKYRRLNMKVQSKRVFNVCCCICQMQIFVCVEIPFCSQTGVSIEDVMMKDLKISDGEIKVAISTVYLTLEVRENQNNIACKQPCCVQRWSFNNDFEPVIFSTLCIMNLLFSDLINFGRSNNCLQSDLHDYASDYSLLLICTTVW